MVAVVITEVAALLLLALLVAGLLRSHAQILRALHELGVDLDPSAPVSPRAVPLTLHQGGQGGPDLAGGEAGGESAYDVVGTRPDGSAVALAVAGAKTDTLLAFLSTGCSTCLPFWAALRRGPAVPGGARLVVVVQSYESESRLRELAGKSLDVVASTEAWEAYGVPGAPHFVYVDGPAARVIGEGTAGTWDEVSDLLGQALADRAARAGMPAAAGLGADTRRDDPRRIDAELSAAGIGPGHPSLYLPPDAEALR